MSDRKWEYCNVRVTTFREGAGDITEQIEVILPGDRTEKKTGHGTGVVKALNELGSEGWEVFEMGASIWLKRKSKSYAAKGRHLESQAKSGITDLDGDGD